MYVPLPQFPLNGAPESFFWWRLPYVLPGFLTFLSGLMLIFFIFTKWTLFKNRKERYAIVGIFLSSAAYGLLSSIRSMMLNDSDLLFYTNLLYPLILFLSPATLYFCYLFYGNSQKPYYYLYLFSYFLVALALISIWRGEAFLSKFLFFDFGKIAVATWPVGLWGFYNLFNFLLYLPKIIDIVFFKKKSSYSLITHLGFCLLIVLIVSGLPSVIGYNIYPLVGFIFIAFLLLIYGLLNDSSIDLDTLLFEKKGAFYLTGLLTAIILIIASLFIGISLKPSQSVRYSYYLLPPLFSFGLTYLISSYILGTNSSKKEALLGATALFALASMPFVLCFRSLLLPTFIQFRIEQFFYIPLPIGITLFYRYVFCALGYDRARYATAIDLSCAIISLGSFSPFLIEGFFEFEFGRFLKGGPLFKFMSIVALYVWVSTIFAWWRKRKVLVRSQNLVFIGYFMFGFLSLLNYPLTIGIEIFPSTSLMFIPMAIIGYAIFINKDYKVEQQTVALSNKYSIIPILFFPVFVLLYFFELDPSYSSKEKILHCLFVFTPFFLGSYVLIFLITRPIAERIEVFIRALEIERNMVQEAKEQSEIRRRKLSRLNELSTKISNATDINYVLEDFYGYLNREFYVNKIWLLDVNQETNRMTTFPIQGLERLFGQNQIDFIRNFDRDINPDLGLLYRTYQTRKIIYLPKLFLFKNKNATDEITLNILEMKNIMQLPLVMGDQCIGIFCLEFDSSRERLKQNDLELLETFSQIASSILQRTRLFRDTLEAKVEALELSNDLKLNVEITKKINSTFELDSIMSMIMEFFRNEFGIEEYALLEYIPMTNELQLISASIPDDISPAIKMKFFTNRISLSKRCGHRFALRQKQLSYFPKINLSMMSEEELFITKSMDIESYLFLPLFNTELLIGFLDFSNFHHRPMLLNDKQLIRIKNFSDQIANALNRSFLFRQLNVINQETEKLAFRNKELNSIAKEFNQSLDWRVITSKINEFSQVNFGFEHVAIYIVNDSGDFLYLFGTEFPPGTSEITKAKIISTKKMIHKKSSKGMHNFVMRKKRSYFVDRINEKFSTEDEILIIRNGNFKKFLAIPMLIKGEVRGIIYFNTTNEDMNITSEIVKDAEGFVDQITGSILNADLLKELNQAYADLKESQDQLIQSEKMAALGQLIAGVAHEINTPLGAIKASIQNMQSAMESTFLQMPIVLEDLKEEEKKLFFHLLDRAKKEKKLLSTREERSIKNALKKRLADQGIANTEQVSESLIEIGIYDKEEEFIEILNKQTNQILNLAYNLMGFQNKTKTIETAVEKASKIVFALKNYTHFEQSESMSKSNMQEGIETVLTIYQDAMKNGIELVTDFDPVQPSFCFPDELNQVWTNLLHNALQAMEYKGKISVRLKQVSTNRQLEDGTKDDLLISIEDNGPGIPAEIQEKIFNPFFTTKKRGEGSGLGLHITRKIIAKHDGTIQVQSEPGKTVFEIRIPYRI